MKKLISITTVIAGFLLIFASCEKDLDTIPLDPDVVTAATVYDDPASYKQVLAKLYAGLAVSGQQGPAGQGDISGIDEGFGQYLRGFWYMQELTTDEAMIAWNDQTIKDLHYQTWGSSDVFISAFYYRVFYQIAVCNEFIRETTDDKLNARGVSGELRTDIEHFRAEARWLRALSYWHALDMFGNVPFVTEEDPVGAFFPEQISRGELFNYLESELLAIEPLMVDARQNEYGRADKAAVWTLLAKLYLNAEVYTGVAKYAECIENCEKVIGAGYTLVDEYQHLFLADNHMLPEVIFSVNYDGTRTQTYGGTNFIIHAAIGGEMPDVYDLETDFGVGGGWGGTRVTSDFVDLFPDETGDADVRAMFFTQGQSKEIIDPSDFTSGYAVTKWRNITSTGEVGSNLDYPDTDFPMFRLADIYLMYAEAVKRGGGGSEATALQYLNLIRDRAEADAINSYDLNYILDERARELYWECHRRTDLIRFNEFTGGEYIWEWKGNVPDGRVTDDKYKLFPIPASDIGANPNLEQNPGY